MNKTSFNYKGKDIQLYICNTAVVGTGAAGYNAADRLWQYGQKDIVIVTENRLGGTSRNTGSDKQTYYKLSLAGGEPDSVREMANTLFSGQCVDGDMALCEAALSAQCFFRLSELGVPFPKNRYGEYVGYKTDHDPKNRATSIGPYTSRRMTECLEKAVKEKNIQILDKFQVIKILSDGKRIYGLLCLNLNSRDSNDTYILIHCKNIIYATGGPAGIYSESVYPYGQYGASGLAFEAGARGTNLTEWQFGLASVRPRWNVSGSYMQVLPRVYSTEQDGTDEKEFLLDFFGSDTEMFNRLFLKGYQWPFDVRKVAEGSSIIDILVYMETSRNRRVYLDYRRNASVGNINYQNLSEEAYNYLSKAEACFGMPIERLAHMNQPAIDLYRDKGVDLYKEPLEIALCVQHNNGGIAVNSWWQTCINGLFVVGEAAGTHGVYRPGGSALNAGQVGSMRAAQFIAAKYSGEPEEGFEEIAVEALDFLDGLAEACTGTKDNVRELARESATQMSRCGGIIRNKSEISDLISTIKWKLENFDKIVSCTGKHAYSRLFRLRDMLMTQLVYLSAMNDYAVQGRGSRGSALYTDYSGVKPYKELPDKFTFKLDDGMRAGETQEVAVNGTCTKILWRKVNPIPEDSDFFENVWREYRQTGGVD